ncbi:sedoheptulose 7-phosphate cyclase [Mesorhizobium sp. CA18]|uniref:sedoheptulose 7-phosphate cyclase n=1 Tax=unclassified Mesorhizobium TaxID=325217 RepID=UPI001CD00E22|nr:MULTISPECIES: sedoheptulose 7-phosphate cyclase [unclassified Mesorhizobium]MBZ9737137.1 sedoheptulose 7-phosphate cyclase [Mesorhizobium sp. CA9]MBZ9826591.1 sedoheptulose 7-phosphate cyclase [Mesorhizobium sp. CA18]MBZ9830818.1 sedoheptulose 7-phosphate cyclase [Mesorhizobium sp. CA2]MBZ9835506.1 sedoheptulose 7-phosphate cyclase [Mesorhizobium sp. CA3]MBZ9875810.1 sedoheptulose 7-phosphate cyclase [Mesorhizobium sp. Ca11]
MWTPTAEQLSLRSSRDHTFNVAFFEGLHSPDFCDWIEAHARNRTVLAVTTPTVEGLYGDEIRAAFACVGLKPSWLVLNCTERTKTMKSVLTVCRAASDAGIDRQGTLVAIGGGVCSDIVTLAASMLRRSLSHLRIPTTLIGQVDAGIGLKGGVNFGEGKNYLGCFHPPEAVAVIPSLLKTLGVDTVRQGLAEMVKIACTSDTDLFRMIEEARGGGLQSWVLKGDSLAHEPIRRAIAAMLRELSKNPFEVTSYERAVDLGHTIAHPLEASTHYELHHGFAVAIDLAFSSILGWYLGWLREETALRIVDLLVAVGLPIWHEDLNEDLVSRSFRAAAKHRGGNINMVVPTDLGRYRFLKREDQCPPGLISEVLTYLRARSWQEGISNSSSAHYAAELPAEENLARIGLQ